MLTTKPLTYLSSVAFLSAVKYSIELRLKDAMANRETNQILNKENGNGLTTN